MNKLSFISQLSAELSTKNLELAELAQPTRVSMLPETLAWKVVFAVIVVVLLCLLYRGYAKHQQAQWKRQAILLANDARQAQQAALWFALIKRVLLVHHSKAYVSALVDKAILAKVGLLDEDTQLELVTKHYQPNIPLSSASNEAIYATFITWLAQLPLPTKHTTKVGV